MRSSAQAFAMPQALGNPFLGRIPHMGLQTIAVVVAIFAPLVVCSRETHASALALSGVTVIDVLGHSLSLKRAIPTR